MANYPSLIDERVKIYERDETDPNKFVARGVLRDVDNEGEGFFIIDNFRFKGLSLVFPHRRVEPLRDYRIVKDEDQPNNNITPFTLGSGNYLHTVSPPYVPSSPTFPLTAMPMGSPFGGTLPDASANNNGVQPIALAGQFNAVAGSGAPLVPTMGASAALTQQYGNFMENLPAFPPPNLSNNGSARRSRRRRATHRKRRATHARRRHRRS